MKKEQINSEIRCFPQTKRIAHQPECSPEFPHSSIAMMNQTSAMLEML